MPVRLAIAAGGGALYAASVPPVGSWWLGWVAIAPLCLACVRARPIVGAAVGLVFGLVAACGTSPWFPTMIGDYFGRSAPWIWPFAILGWTLCGAAYHAMLGAWLAWALERGPVSPIAVGAAWWLIDWTRANALVANPWALLGYSQMGFLPTAQLADVIGPYGLGAWLAASGATFAGLVAPGFRGGSIARSALALVVLFGCSVTYGVVRLAVEPTPGESVRAALVQGALPPPTRSDPNAAAANLEHHLSLTASLASEDVDLALWPELALDFYLEREPRLGRRLVEALDALDIELITGGLGIDAEARLPTNSVFFVNGQGIRSRYDKVHLMAFSEANPLPFDIFGRDAMTAGRGVRLMRRGKVAYGLAICSEAMHPGYVREVVRAGADVLVMPSVDSWFASLGGRRQQLDAVAMRAIETRRFVLRPTANGITSAIDPQGRIIAELAVDQPGALIAAFEPRREITTYVRLGDAGVAAALLLLVGDAARRARRPPEQEFGSSDDES